MPATKWRCTKCGKTTSTNGPRPFAGGCGFIGIHNWVKDSFIGPYWDRILKK